MGNYTSKLFSLSDDNKLKLSTSIKLGVFEKQHPCTPIMTRRHLTADPRSATLGIVRTPIESAETPTGSNVRVVSAIPKHLRTKQYLETDIDSVMPTFNSGNDIFDPRSPNVDCKRTPISIKPSVDYLTPLVHVKQIPDAETPLPLIHGLDPRSPAIDFERTPILKPKSAERLNVAHENVSSNNTELPKVQLAYCETVSCANIPEIQVLPEITLSNTTKKRLELRDVTDDHSDFSFDKKSDSDDSDSEGHVTVIQNVKSSTSDVKKSVLYDSFNGEDLTNFVEKQNDDEYKGDKDESRKIVFESMIVPKKLFVESEDKIRIWRDSISPQLPTESSSTVETNMKREDIMIEFDDNSIIKPTGQMKIAETNDAVKTDENNRIKSKRKPQLYKKEIKNIFDDTKIYNTDGSALSVCKNRTPLANRSNSHKSEMPSKSPQQLLRNKCLSTKSQQQENTPPRNKQSTKRANYSHWDMDKTVII